MESSFFSDLADFVDRSYRKLVADCARDKPPKVEEALGVLGFAQRSADQLDGDVRRLLTRRADAALLEDIAKLESDVERLTEDYKNAVAAKSETSAGIERAKASARNRDDPEAHKLVNAARCAYADARTDAEAAWNKLRATRERRDAMRDEVEGRLKGTAAATGHWADPENYALV